MKAITSGSEIDVNNQFVLAMNESLSGSLESSTSPKLVGLPATKIKEIAAIVNKKEKKKSNKRSHIKSAPVGTSKIKEKRHASVSAKKLPTSTFVPQPNAVFTEKSAMGINPTVYQSAHTSTDSRFQSSPNADNKVHHNFQHNSEQTFFTDIEVLTQNLDCQQYDEYQLPSLFASTTHVLNEITDTGASTQTNNDTSSQPIYQQLDSLPRLQQTSKCFDRHQKIFFLTLNLNLHSQQKVCFTR